MFNFQQSVFREHLEIDHLECDREPGEGLEDVYTKGYRNAKALYQAHNRLEALNCFNPSEFSKACSIFKREMRLSDMPRKWMP